MQTPEGREPQKPHANQRSAPAQVDTRGVTVHQFSRSTEYSVQSLCLQGCGQALIQDHTSCRLPASSPPRQASVEPTKGHELHPLIPDLGDEQEAVSSTPITRLSNRPDEGFIPWPRQPNQIQSRRSAPWWLTRLKQRHICPLPTFENSLKFSEK